MERVITIADATIALDTPYKLSYSAEDKTLLVDIAIHAIMDKAANALVYFPLRPRWNPPHGHQPISAEATDIISDRIEAALKQMGYNVKFCLPMGMQS